MQTYIDKRISVKVGYASQRNNFDDIFDLYQIYL